ncbi:glutathione S-transferase family protein [Novosphingobium sp.]|uniref:glutathione S-transferase family protein n=1 Tax=Novosphingobium sp. TaxID=1874826 RepID=UPI0025CDC434|nr:glutathione S-transferase family protein [Novosphingobium sp.]
MLTLFGHPFSSYTWKALIALYANATPFVFRELRTGNIQTDAFVASAGPSGQFPVLRDGDITVFEATSIVEHLHRHHPGPSPLLPKDEATAIRVRMWDRVFDLHVMNVMQQAVSRQISEPEIDPSEARSEVRDQLHRSYRWIEKWLAGYIQRDKVTLIECAAAPSLFYADWVIPVPCDCPRVKAWREHLLALPPVARCVEEARPYRHLFPLGAPDRD